MQTDFCDKFQELHNTGNPFAIATVVRADKLTPTYVAQVCYFFDKWPNDESGCSESHALSKQELIS